MAMTKVKSLQLWCKKMTDGYRDVDVKDMTTSWKNGLAFCALIHKFRPDLIDYDSLSKENVFENNQLAFEVAERELNIPAFLDAPDMVAIKVPDRLSVVTYVSQYYNNLHDKPQLGGPGVKKTVATKRHQPDPELGGPEAKKLTPSHQNAKTPSKDRQSMGDKCHICGDKVYLMERHVDKNKLFHRHCFRHSDLSPTSKVFNKSELKKISDKVKSENETKKLSDKVKSENDTNKAAKSDNKQPNFWERRNEARKILKMDTEESVPSKGTANQDKNSSKSTNKDISKPDIIVTSDNNISKDAAKSKKERPSDLNLETKVDTKKSSPLPSPRKPKTSNVEPMDTSEISDVKLKPVPTPRIVRDEKKTSPLNGILSKKREKSPGKSPFLSPNQGLKLSSSSDMSPLSPPPLPSQPPPPQLTKSNLLSPESDAVGTSAKVTANFGEKSKPLTSHGRKSPQTSAKNEVSSSRSSNSPDRGSSVFISPRTKEFSPTFSDSSASSDSSKFSSSSKENKTSPKTTNQRSSNFSPPLSKPKFGDKRQMSVEEAIDLTKNDTNRNEMVAVVFTPSPKEENDKQVLGGLLSNLANIRRKQKPSDTSPSEDLLNQRNTTGALDIQSRDQKGQVKSAIFTKPLSESDQNKHSVNKESHLKNISKTDTDIPEWKRQLEKNKNLRPKSADILSDKKTSETSKTQLEKDAHLRPKTEMSKVSPRPKTVDVLSDKFKTDQKPQWQIEAEKRMEARKGGYVDPEKVRPQIDVGKDQLRPKEETKLPNDRSSTPLKPSRVDIKITDDKRESANVQKRILPTIPSLTEKGDNKDDIQDKKKISVNVKFNFSQGKKEEEKEEKFKPPRPPTYIHNSPNAGSPNKPTRPPPPLKDGDQRRLSPSEIQKQLTQIDSRLTELEIRGRQLEDSIRKVQEEEDDKMMVEWFELVNNKNELVRKEADLIYLSRAQELEGEQNEIDRQLRALLQKNEKYKTEEDKVEEEQLIQKLLDVVNQRNIIVDSIDEDRIRYEEEDKDIAMALQDFMKVNALSQESGHVTIQSTEASFSKKKKKKKKKGKLL
ncbi:MICAL-like protein 1 isoform X3 [Mytilus californianus]|uniref:MICAL-like protein 1 isoform X3 n=1 Tax=Mytilus californianus TaxID=6549 RepID=UPI002247E9EC|nr:MICAL-like protein 1 isoform X3 [Mytilus californianus]